MRRIDHTEPQISLRQPDSHFLTPTEAAANAFVAPLLAAMLFVIGGALAGIAAAIVQLYDGRWSNALWAIVWGVMAGLILAAIRLLGIFDAISRLLDLAAIRLDVDTDQDGDEDQEEVNAAITLFTEDGIKAFIKEVMFRRRDWKSRFLVPAYLTREEYDVLIGDILPTIGILGESRRNQTRPLLIPNEAEATRAIDAYFRRPQRRVWTFTIGDKRIVL